MQETSAFFLVTCLGDGGDLFDPIYVQCLVQADAVPRLDPPLEKQLQKGVLKA